VQAPGRRLFVRGAILLAISIPRTKGSQVRVCHEPKKIAKFSDVQLTVLISIGHLELRLNEA
jgi:hypothetical protein